MSEATGSSTDEAIIRVRCPTASTESDYTVVVKLSTNIGELKERLSVESPWKPKVADQRIIFVGKILEDTALVKDALSKVDISTPQTFHLVVRSGDSSPVAPGGSQSNGKRSAEEVTAGTPVYASGGPEVHSYQLTASQSSSSSTGQGTDLSQRPIPTSGIPFLMHLQQLGVPYEIVVIRGIPYALHPQVPQFSAVGASGFPLRADLAPLMRLIIDNGVAQAPPPVPPPPAANLQEILNNPFAAIAAFLGGAGAPQLGGEQGGQVEDDFAENAVAAQQNPIWLFLKLAFMSYMFSQGSDRYRIITINAVALLIFVVQTGFAGWIYRMLRGAPPAVNVPNNVHNDAPAVANENNNNNNPDQEQPAVQPPVAEPDGAPLDHTPMQPAETPQPLPPRVWYLELKDIAFAFVTSLIPEQPNVI